MSVQEEEKDYISPENVDKIGNYFEDDKREILFGKPQYPFSRKLKLIGDKWFCIVIPKSSFIEYATSWADFKKGKGDYKPMNHYITLQFIAEALQNSRKHGTAPDMGDRRGFYFRRGNQRMLKFEIIIELLVKDLHRGEDWYKEESQQRTLSRYDLMSDTNVVGFRFFFVANDPNFDFTEVIQKQVKYNRKTMSFAIYESDDSDSEKEGSGNDIIDKAFEEDEAEEAPGDNGAEKNNRSRKSNKKRPKSKRDKIVSELMTPGKKTRRPPSAMTFSKHPRKMYLNITSLQKLAIIMFDSQTENPEFYNNKDILDESYDMKSPNAELSLSILHPVLMIEQCRLLGCHPYQCDPDNYIKVSNKNSNLRKDNMEYKKKVDEILNDLSEDSDDSSSGNSEGDTGDNSRGDKKKDQLPGFEGYKRQRVKLRIGEHEKENSSSSECCSQSECDCCYKNDNNDQFGVKMKFENDGDPNADEFFQLPFPDLGWQIHPKEFTASSIFETRFPWISFSRETLEQKRMSVILWCGRTGNFNASYCDDLLKSLTAKYTNLQAYYSLRNEKRFNQSIGMNLVVEDGHGINDNSDYVKDPTSIVSKIMIEIEMSLFRIYGKNQKKFSDFIEQMRSVALKQMYRVVNKDNQDLPDPVLVLLNHLHDKGINKLCEEVNMFTLDLGAFTNALQQMLFMYEMDEVATNHVHLLQVIQAIMSAYLDKNRTHCDMKNNICFHGAPGTGKSAMTEKANEYFVQETIDDIVARSNMAMIAPKARNFVVELYDESSAIFDLPDSKLSSAERKTRRMETSAMSKQRARYDCTRINKDTGKRSIETISMEYNHVKILCTNTVRKKYKDAMDDRAKHITVMDVKRTGHSIVDYQTATLTRAVIAQRDKIKRFHEKLQALMMLSCLANKLVMLPNPNMSLLHTRMAQTFDFLKKHVPNLKHRVRAWKMMQTEATVNVFHYAIHMVFFSELSPYRILTKNQKYIDSMKKKRAYQPEDPKNMKCTFEDFKFEHLKSIGPYLVCTDDIAIRVITDVVYNLLDPQTYQIAYYLALEFGNLDVNEIFDYYDDRDSPNGYWKQKEYFTEIDLRIAQCLHEAEKNGNQQLMQSESERIMSEITSELDSNRKRIKGGKVKPKHSLPSEQKGEMSSLMKELALVEKPEGMLTVRNDDYDSDDDDDDDDFISDKEMQEKEYIDNLKALRFSIAKPIISDKKKKKGKKNNQGYQWEQEDEEPKSRDFVMEGGARGLKKYKRKMEQREHRGKKKSLLVQNMPEFIPAAGDKNETNVAGRLYNTSYLKLNKTVAMLKGAAGSDFCLKYGIDRNTFSSTLDALTKRFVKVQFCPDVPLELTRDPDYVRYSIANKMNPDAELVHEESSEALLQDEECCYLNIDILFENPRRVINNLVENFEYAHTRERKILLGVANKNQPYCLQDKVIKPKPGKHIRTYNVRHMPQEIVDATNNEALNKTNRVSNPDTRNRVFNIKEDLEVRAYKQHFIENGYNTDDIVYFLPEYTEKMLHAIYQYGEHAEQFVGLASQKYLIQRGIREFDHPKSIELTNKYEYLIDIIRSTRRKENNCSLKKYPEDYIPNLQDNDPKKNKKNKKQIVGVQEVQNVAGMIKDNLDSFMVSSSNKVRKFGDSFESQDDDDDDMLQIPSSRSQMDTDKIQISINKHLESIGISQPKNSNQGSIGIVDEEKGKEKKNSVFHQLAQVQSNTKFSKKQK